MKTLKLTTPILFVIFRRKDTALKVIDAISKVKPERLYISQDGPRNSKEAFEVEETRKAVLAKITWNCKLIIWSHSKNLGLKKHIPEAFDRLFKKENCCIYLEDDTLPNKDFFYYEEELLKKYKDDKKIFSINATNFYQDKVKPKSSYYLSQIGDVWGFGIWKRSWKLYSSEMKDFNRISRSETYKSYFFSSNYKFYLETFWKAILNKKLDSWAMQLVYSAIKNNMYFMAPGVNMVNNIGVRHKATNIALQQYYADYGSPFPLRHPDRLVYDSKYDLIYFSNMLKGGWLRLFLIKLYLLVKCILHK
jgi:hypothetical protein